MTLNYRAGLSVICSFICLAVNAAPPEIDPAKDLPRFPAVEPADAIKTFKIKPGFHLDQVAAEPLVTDPVTICFDENGRMFVVEMTDYSERREEIPHLGSVKLLEDTDGDGKFDTASTYADKLPWPTGVFPWDGGIFVIATPDLIYFKDTNGDKKADIRKVIYTGFGNSRGRLNVQGLANSLNWGLDNRIHGLAAPNGGIMTNLVRVGDKPLDCNNRNFSFNARTFQMFPENGGGQYGMTFNTRGRKFTCSNSDHLMTFMYEARYADRNPYYAMPKPLASIGVDGGAAEVFRLSPEEPWRVIRTKWRVSGIATGPVEGGGRASGYFTGASGATIYRGNAFPADFLDNAFTADAGGNLVHRKLVIPQDVGYKAQRPDDEKNMEFMASSDTWFRPTHFQNAPDGCFYVIDMYREVIEHPWSLPEPLKKHIDLNSGNDRGRIYRITPDGYKQPKLPALGKAKTAELVATLAHANGWHRETAARLLFTRQDKSAVSPLTRLLEKSPSPFGRMHALHALDGLNALKESHILRGLADADERVREHAVKLAEKLVKKVPSTRLWAALREMHKDPSLFVVYQLAFTLGEMQHPERNMILAQCLGRNVESVWMRAAVLSSLATGAGEMVGIVSSDPKFVANPHGQKFLGDLAVLVGAKNDATEVNAVLRLAGASSDAGVVFGLMKSLGEGLQQSRSSLAEVAQPESLKLILAKANEVAVQKEAPQALRLQAIQMLGSADFNSVRSNLLALLDQSQPQEIQLTALKTLGKFTLPGVGTELIMRWNSFPPRLREEATAVMLARPDRAVALLEAVRTGAVRRTDLTTTQAKFLRTHRDSTVRGRALTALGAEAVGKRKEIVDAYMSALNLTGNANHGKAIYQERCLSCHRLGGEGFALGPDLVTVQSTGKEKMLLGILDPNGEVAPQFQAYEIETSDDESYIGLIVNETATSVTIRQAYGKEDTILRTNIRKMKGQNQTLMPEGLEAGLKLQDIADLLEYVATAK